MLSRLLLILSCAFLAGCVHEAVYSNSCHAWATVTTTSLFGTETLTCTDGVGNGAPSQCQVSGQDPGPVIASTTGAIVTALAQAGVFSVASKKLGAAEPTPTPIATPSCIPIQG